MEQPRESNPSKSSGTDAPQGDHTKHPFYVFASGFGAGVIATAAVFTFIISENYTRTTSIEATLKAQERVVIPQSEYERLKARDAPSSAAHELRITRVDLDLDSEKRTEQALRINAVVNGNVKSYPTDGNWAQRGPDFSSEPFPVAEASEYSIRFEVWAKDARGLITRFVAHSGQTIAARNLPIRNASVELKEEGTGGLVGGRVRFSIE